MSGHELRDANKFTCGDGDGEKVQQVKDLHVPDPVESLGSQMVSKTHQE